MCNVPSFVAAVIVSVACVRSICLSQVYHYQNTEDHPGGSLSCGQLCKGQHNFGDEKLACPEWFLLEGRRGCHRKGVSRLLPLLPGSSQTPVERDKGQLIWLPLEQPSLSALCCEPGALLQSPLLLGSPGVLCTGYRPWRHFGPCDDKDLLWEALISSPSYAHGAGSGHWPVGDLGLVTLSFPSPSWK